RPNLSTFYSSLQQVDLPPASTNPHLTPIPGDVAASFRLLGEAMEAMMSQNPDRDLADSLVSFLFSQAETPPTKPQGMPAEFIEGLERVDRKRIKKGDECPICGEEFLDDQYPLVVRLPCNDKHVFDLECIQPWLKLNSTCPLDRKDLGRKRPPTPPPANGEGGEEEYDDMYA
ncbi:MAG: hypothetical protein LQ340_001877, partial [Diploschistes diacapsis]